MKDPAATLMFAEAAEAPAAVARQSANGALMASLGDRLRASPPRLVATCARGSSDYAATYAKYLLETATGVPVVSMAPSVSSIYGAIPRYPETLCLAISQSGRSPDLLSAASAARTGGAFLAAMVNDEASPLAAAADLLLPLHAGPERSVAATKSFVAALAALLDLAAAWTGDPELRRAHDQAPEALAAAWNLDWSALAGMLAAARGLYVVGRGVGFAAAQEAALKLKETCGLQAEAFSAAELRHGPLALVGPCLPVLLLRQGDRSDLGLNDLARDLAERGAPVLLAGRDLPITDAPPLLQPLCQILSFYRAAAALSVRRGYDPDRPAALRKITETV